MKIKLTRSVIVRGQPGAQVGGVLDVDAHTAHELVSCGAAVDYVAEVVKPAEIVTREPVVEHREPEIKTPKRPRK
jgi:hypothetical protein